MTGHSIDSLNELLSDLWLFPALKAYLLMQSLPFILTPFNEQPELVYTATYINFILIYKVIFNPFG